MAFILLFLALPAFGQVALELGSAEETFTQDSDFESYNMPVGPAGNDGPIRGVVAEGTLTQKVWNVPITATTTLRIMDALRQGLERTGFEVLYECETQVCGGFDFRFETRVVPEPVMHVDLGDFRYLAVQRLGRSVPEYLSLLVSRSSTQGYVQMIHVGPSDVETIRPSTGTVTPVNSGPFESKLEREGGVVLDDLKFEIGSSRLGQDSFPSLEALSVFLKKFPERRVILVGHTDAVGSLEGNISLSRNRAQSVVDRLVGQLGVSRGQLRAEGVGYLSPASNNLTEEGRTKNRRVEAVLASTQ
ncbi:MAG: OmpA family protein [Litoreibacter sp.]